MIEESAPGPDESPRLLLIELCVRRYTCSAFSLLSLAESVAGRRGGEFLRRLPARRSFFIGLALGRLVTPRRVTLADFRRGSIDASSVIGAFYRAPRQQTRPL